MHFRNFLADSSLEARLKRRIGCELMAEEGLMEPIYTSSPTLILISGVNIILRKIL